MEHFDGTALRGTETFIPAPLLEVLLALEHASSTEAIWQALVTIGAALNLPTVEYLYASGQGGTDPRGYSTNPEGRAGMLFRQGAEGAATHARRFLTPLLVGPAFHAVAHPHLQLASDSVLNAGVVFPLRSTEPGQSAAVLFGGPQDRGTLSDILRNHGWTLHVAAMTAHARHTVLFKQETLARCGLTEKQTDLLRLVGEGLMDKQIAHRLGISFSAVRQRLAGVQQKTGAQNRAELAALAACTGLVPDPLLNASLANGPALPTPTAAE